MQWLYDMWFVKGKSAVSWVFPDGVMNDFVYDDMLLRDVEDTEPNSYVRTRYKVLRDARPRLPVGKGK
jgi:hypothetical protein